MAMGPGMNMDSDALGDSAVTIAPAQSTNHTMFKLDFARNPVEHTARFESGPRIPSGSITACAEEACSHVALFSSPPNTHGLLIHSLCLAAISLPARLEVLNNFGLTEDFDTSPPRLLSTDQLVALRI